MHAMHDGKQDCEPATDQVKTYYKRCGLSALVIALVGLAVVGMMAYTFVQATRHHWPKIKNPDVLVRDCKVLMATYRGNQTRDQWPQSVRDLRPIIVMINSRHDVFIPFSFGGALGGKQWGYLVFADPSDAKQFKTDGQANLKPTEHPNIFKLEESF